MSTALSGTLSALDIAAKEEELRANAKDKTAKPVRRSNSFNRRKKKPEEAQPGADASALEDGEQMKKPAFKTEVQADPLRESLQEEAIELFKSGNYDGAGEKWYYLAEAARNAGDLSQEAMAMQNMGTSLVNLDQLEQAFACYDRALQLAEQAEDNNAQIDSYLSLKWLFHEVGALSNAVRCLEHVVDLVVQTGDNVGLCSALLELGQLHLMQEDWKAAAERLEASLKAATDHRPTELVLQASILSELSTAILELEGPEGALPAYAQAIDSADKSGDSELQLRTRHDMAMLLLHSLNRVEAAEAMLSKLVDLAKQAAAAAAPNSNAALHAMEMEGRGCIELGPLLVRSGKLEEAQLLAARGIELAKRLDIDEASGVCHTQMGDALLAASKPGEALPHLETARDVWRRVAAELHSDLLARRARAPRQFIREHEEHQSLFDNSAKDTYVKLAAAILGSAGGEVDTQTAAAALFAIEEGRAATLGELLDLGATPIEELEADIDLSAEPQRASERAPPLSPPFDMEQLASLMAALYGESAAADAGAVVYWSLGPSAAPEAKTTDGEAASAGKSELWAWVITPDCEIKMHRGDSMASDGQPLSEVVWDLMEKLRLGAHSMVKRGIELSDEQVAALRERFGSDGGSDLDIDQELKVLSERLLLPILPWLPPGAPVTLVPHFYLNLVPFGALPLPNGKPLITAHAISQAPSLAVLHHMAKRQAAAQAAAHSDSLVLTVPESAPVDKLPPMPAATLEGELVASVLKTPPELQLSGSAATLSSLMAGLDKPLATVHISAHMPQRYVVLAPQPKPEPCAKIEELSEDNNFPKDTARPAPGRETDDADASQWDERLLDAAQVHALWLGSHPSVVLGGSHGGAGALSQDGVVGLPRAFLAAGAHSVLATLWDAIDEPTTSLLYHFHAQCANQVEAEALRAAVLLLREEEEGKWSHPLYWAGFVLTGAK